MDAVKYANIQVRKIIMMIVITLTFGLIPIVLDYIPNALAQNTFMTPDQQSRLGERDANGDYLYQCPGNTKTITIPGDIKFTSESFSQYEAAFCAY
jgi:hypothetical protein